MNQARDERIEKLEQRLAEEYRKRRGAHHLTDEHRTYLWVWCFECGAHLVCVHLVGDSGYHCRDGRCPSCQEKRRAAIEGADRVLNSLSSGVTTWWTEGEIAEARVVATQAQYEPPAGLAGVIGTHCPSALAEWRKACMPPRKP